MNNANLRYGVDLGNKVILIDTGFVRPEYSACYVISQRAPSGDRLAIIDTGTNFSISRILGTIMDIGCNYDQVDFIILTHIDLDNAGGVGLLLQYCPNAKLVLHPRGVRSVMELHTLFPRAVSIYGEDLVDKEYGKIIPFRAKKILEVTDGFLINLAGRILTVLETPGLSKNNISIWDELTQSVFTGDTFGFFYPQFDIPKSSLVIPVTTPIQFDPKLLRISLKKIMALGPNSIYLRHFGRVGLSHQFYENFLNLLDEIEILGKQLKTVQNRHDFLKEGLLNIYLGALKSQGCQLSDAKIQQLLKFDLEKNAQGLGIWLG